jgi:ComF family protein
MAPMLDLCEVCAAALPWHAINTPASHDFVPFRYHYPVDHFIRRLKFHGERKYARLLGALFARTLRAQRPSWPPVIIPVPLHNARYRSRGFNQAAQLAHFAAATLGCQVLEHRLVRHRATAEQSRLRPAARRHNVQDVFSLNQALNLEQVALLDDVTTTGATLDAAAQALWRAGVQHIERWAIASARGGADLDQ